MSDPVTAAVAASGVAASATSAAASAGFWGALAGFVAGWAFLILGVILVLGMISEHTDSSGWSIFFLFIAGAVVFMSFSVSWTMLAIYAGAYLVVGLLWSFWRYKRHAEKVVAKNKTADARQKQQALESLHPKEMLGSITAWILVWPFSLVQNLLGDIINFIQALVTKFFRGVYHRIYDAAVAALQ